MRKYQVNFQKSKNGNVFKYGTKHLRVTIPNARSYVTASLYQIKNGHAKLIIVGQSKANHHTTTALRMAARNGQPLPVGKYRLLISADAGSSFSNGWKDSFSIVKKVLK